MSDFVGERYRGHELRVERRTFTDGWYFAWRDPLYRTGYPVVSAAKNGAEAMEDARRFIDQRIAGEAAEVERGLARMG